MKKCDHCGMYQSKHWIRSWCNFCTYPNTIYEVKSPIKKEVKRY